MGIRVSWDNDEKTIVRHSYNGHWTISDFYNCVDDSARLLHSVDHPVDLIIDMGDCAPPPNGILRGYRYADSKVPDNQRLVIVVQASDIQRVYDHVADNITVRAGRNRVSVDTMEEAYDVIAQYQAQPEVL